MKKLSHIFGLIVMVVMMTMTSCGGDSKDSEKDISEDVRRLCDAFDEGADLFNNCESLADVWDAFQEVERIFNDVDKEGIDPETELTDDDKEALQESFVGYTETMSYKLIDVGLGQNSRSEAEEQMRKLERHVGEILDECETLGEFSSKISSVDSN